MGLAEARGRSIAHRVRMWPANAEAVLIPLTRQPVELPAERRGAEGRRGAQDRSRGTAVEPTVPPR